MTVAELVSKISSELRGKKQVVHSSIDSEFRDMLRRLASGEELDSGDVGRILSAAGKSEDDFERDTKKQEQRFIKVAERERNLQSIADRLRAERALADAMERMRIAVAKIQPDIDVAQQQISDANLVFSCTMGAESWLCDPSNILHSELLTREAAVVEKLREVNSELSPLLQDREHKQSSLMNAELRLRQLTGRNPDDWPGFGMINPSFWSNKDIEPAKERVADVRSQLAQLEQAIRPRQIEQARLQAELNQIHQQKLLP